jgi:hypothetical protein
MAGPAGRVIHRGNGSIINSLEEKDVLFPRRAKTGSESIVRGELSESMPSA